MVERFIQGKLQWVCLMDPSPNDVHEIMSELAIPPQLMTDLTTPVPKSTAVAVDSVLKVTLDFPIVKRTDIDHPHEIKFIFSKDYLVTVQYEDVGAIEKFKKEFDVLTTLHKTSTKATGAHLFISLMNMLYETASTKLDYLESRFADIEAGIFKGREKQMVFEISNVSKRLITFRQILKTHDDVLHEAKPLFETVFKKPFGHELVKIHTQYLHILRRTTALVETLDDLRDTNTALLSTKQNEIMKIFTILAFITFPLTLFTSTFGMNTTATPILGHPYDFWIIISVMIVVSVAFFAFFKYKDWI